MVIPIKMLGYFLCEEKGILNNPTKGLSSYHLDD
jgi:hypothetical protein